MAKDAFDNMTMLIIQKSSSILRERDNEDRKITLQSVKTVPLMGKKIRLNLMMLRIPIDICQQAKYYPSR